ncbi:MULTISPECIES: acyl-CoA thioesterase [unclassified Lentilitoribacter]|jgi:acyl-CoA thioesterase-2|uniref:acyl-CoA thioesterase n=1 Tax=unclassified Lentilitoribacter TaxID=2647570 RepID=UPI0013A6FB79|nr:acyl-CoA thioesterase II [Lentilitoribacter sp. Alg239-R112]
MSRKLHESVAKLLNSLELTEVGEDRFVVHSPDFGRLRIFGGQFLAQAVAAAQKTVAVSRHVHSFHSYFLRAGNPELPLEIQVTRVRDGASFSMRSVEVYQNDLLVFTMQLSFHLPRDGFCHQNVMPHVPMPEDIDFEAFLSSKDAKSCAGFVAYATKERPFDFRPTSFERYMGESEKRPQQSIWLRLKQPMNEPLDQALSAAILAYASDTLFIDTALMPHGVSIFEGVAHSVSLDQAVWFHHPLILDDWILFDMHSPISSGGRGMAQGSFFTRDGTLVATVAQEGLIRKRSHA